MHLSCKCASEFAPEALIGRSSGSTAISSFTFGSGLSLRITRTRMSLNSLSFITILIDCATITSRGHLEMYHKNGLSVQAMQVALLHQPDQSIGAL